MPATLHTEFDVETRGVGGPNPETAKSVWIMNERIPLQVRRQIMIRCPYPRGTNL